MIKIIHIILLFFIISTGVLFSENKNLLPVSNKISTYNLNPANKFIAELYNDNSWDITLYYSKFITFEKVKTKTGIIKKKRLNIQPLFVLRRLKFSVLSTVSIMITGSLIAFLTELILKKFGFEVKKISHHE